MGFGFWVWVWMWDHLELFVVGLGFEGCRLDVRWWLCIGNVLGRVMYGLS